MKQNNYIRRPLTPNLFLFYSLNSFRKVVLIFIFQVADVDTKTLIRKLFYRYVFMIVIGRVIPTRIKIFIIFIPI